MPVCCFQVKTELSRLRSLFTVTLFIFTISVCIRSSATYAQNADDGLRSSSVSSSLKCQLNDILCERDWIGYESIAQLHSRIDDDKNGGLDRLESDEFIREDLNHQDGKSGQANFHGSDDFITVQDLWQLWVASKGVHSDMQLTDPLQGSVSMILCLTLYSYKWTVDDTIDWLTYYVELPQYSESFRINSIDGRVLPRLASSSQAVGSILGIKNSVHRQKLAVKAMDLVMFGPPKVHHSILVDIIITASVLIASIVTWIAYRERRSTDTQMTKLMQDMAALQSAEESLIKLQRQVEITVHDQQKVLSDRYELERKLRLEIESVKGETEILKRQHMTAEEQLCELKQTEEELSNLRAALSAAERRLEDSYNIPSCLQPWLQLTYDVETRYFEAKRKSAEAQLKAAKDMCEKLHSEKGQLFSALRMAHSSSLDDTDQTIYNVRCALEDTKRSLQERMHRWQQIENLCGFSITASLITSQSLDTKLELPSSDGKMYQASSFGSQLDVDLVDDDMPSLPLVAQVAAASASRELPRLQSAPAFQRSSALSRIESDLSVASSLSQTTPVRQLRFKSKTQKTDSTKVVFECGDDSWSDNQMAGSSDDQLGTESSPSTTESDGAGSVLIHSYTDPSCLNSPSNSLSVCAVSSSANDDLLTNDDTKSTSSESYTKPRSDIPAAACEGKKSGSASNGKDGKQKSSLGKFFGKSSKRKTS